MTQLDVLYRYGVPPSESATLAMAKVREVYGVRRMDLDEAKKTVRVEYDASRLTEPVIHQLLRRAGLVYGRREGKRVYYRLKAEDAVVGLLGALGRVGERSSAEIARIMTSYFRARDELEPVSRKELLDRLRSGVVTLLDVRPEDEFAHGHLAGALNVPLAQLELRLAELPPEREVVAYCRGPWCVLSFEAVALLRRRGYQVRRLEDGFPEWKVAGLPIDSAPMG